MCYLFMYIVLKYWKCFIVLQSMHVMIGRCTQSPEETPLTKDDVRLVGGARDNYGRVEIRYENVWGTVCRLGWYHSTARTICSMLGYAYGHTINSADYQLPAGDANSKIWLRDVRCTGTESSISLCPHREWGNTPSCQHGHDIAIMCFNDGYPYINRHRYGVIQLWKGGWRGICSEDWDDVDATVACRQVGWNAGQAFRNNALGRLTNQMWTRFDCKGSESRLFECTYTNLTSSSQCPDYQTAGVICYSSSKNYPQRVELRTAHAHENCPDYRCGRAFIVYRDVRGTICDDDWTVEDATVLCKTKGFSAGLPLCCGAFSWSGYPEPVWFRDLACTGSETNILACPAADKNGNNYAVSRCRHTKTDVGAICYKSTDPEFENNAVKVRLVGGYTADVGRVEVKYRGVWGAVSDKNWTATDALVVCRELNSVYTAAIPLCCSLMGSDWTRPVLMFDVTCSGSESSLVFCSHAGWANQTLAKSWKQNHNVAVTCLTDQNANDTEFKISASRNGLAMLTYGKTWGAICKDGWGDTEASLFCQKVGYKGGVANTYPPNVSPVWIRDVNCSGKQSFTKCAYKGWIIDDCGSQNKASVFCYNSYEKKLRLRGGGPGYGRIEFAVDDEWGTICHHGFTDQCALQTCRQLGYASGKAFVSAKYGHGQGRIWQRIKTCGSVDTPVWDNSHYGWGHTPYCSHGTDVSVFCSDTQVCGGPLMELSGLFGRLLSGAWPSAYPVDCVQNWRITVDVEFRVVVAFHHFQVMNSANCSGHSVSVYDGPDVTSSLIGSYCGTKSYFTIESTNNKMYLKFEAKGGSSHAGFTAEFTAECIGRALWKHGKSGVTITGKSYEKLENITSAKDCFDACDTSADVCLGVYLHKSSTVCYLYLPNNIGLVSITINDLEEFKRTCQRECTGYIHWIKDESLTTNGKTGANDILFYPNTSLLDCQKRCISERFTCASLAYESAAKKCYLKLSDYIAFQSVPIPSSGVDAYTWHCFDCGRKVKQARGYKFAVSKYRIPNLKFAKSMQQCRSYCNVNVGCKSLDFDTKTGSCFLYTESATSSTTALTWDSISGFVYEEYQCKVKTAVSKCQDNKKVKDSYIKTVTLSPGGLAIECLAECQKDPLCSSVTLSDCDANRWREPSVWKTDICQLNYHYFNGDVMISSSNSGVCQFL